VVVVRAWPPAPGRPDPPAPGRAEPAPDRVGGGGAATRVEAGDGGAGFGAGGAAGVSAISTASTAGLGAGSTTGGGAGAGATGAASIGAAAGGATVGVGVGVVAGAPGALAAGAGPSARAAGTPIPGRTGLGATARFFTTSTCTVFDRPWLKDWRTLPASTVLPSSRRPPGRRLSLLLPASCSFWSLIRRFEPDHLIHIEPPHNPDSLRI